MRAMGWSVRGIGRVLTVAVAAASLSGCVGWSTYPPDPGQKAFADPNEPHMTDVMVSGFNWVIRKFPPAAKPGEAAPASKVAINLPPELRPLVHQRTIKRIDNGVALTPQTQSLPTYHLVSLRVRGDEAQCNILRPMAEVEPAPSGEQVYQEIRVSLRGGVRYWEVVGHREWTPAPATPELHYFDEAAAARAEAAIGGG